jgi:hypothetical protein
MNNVVIVSISLGGERLWVLLHYEDRDNAVGANTTLGLRLHEFEAVSGHGELAAKLQSTENFLCSQLVGIVQSHAVHSSIHLRDPTYMSSRGLAVYNVVGHYSVEVAPSGQALVVVLV